MPRDVCVVVPTVRDHEVCRDYVANARAHGFDPDRLEFVLVTEDHCDVDGMVAMLEDLGVAGEVFDASRRERWFAERGLGRYADLVPARSHAQTSFGLLYLWDAGHPIGVFLDDDTRPHADVDFFGTHLATLEGGRPVEVARSSTRWVNVLRGADADLYPRGFPYAAMDETYDVEPATSAGVVASQGLWTGVPDLDAVRILAEGDVHGRGASRTTADDYGADVVAAPGHYLTVCSMNLAFRREVVPAFYQWPMDDNPWGVGRFDDIWSGVVLQRACDVLDDRVVSGAPLCVHEKAPRSTFGDLAAEAAGLELNEHLWAIVDDVGGDADDYAGVARAVADRLAGGDWDDLHNGGFLAHAGERLHDWLDCLEALEAPPEAPAATATADD